MMFLYLWIFVQIILESLPVSSSGHVMLLKKICDSFDNVHPYTPQQESIIDFLLHGPMLFIIGIFFFKQWWNMIFHTQISYRTVLCKSGLIALLKPMTFLVIADGITILFWYAQWTLSIPLWAGFTITAAMLFASRYVTKNNRNFDWNLAHALILGLVQGMSLASGISRFGMTYTTSIFLGYKGTDALAMSFGIQMPLIFAAFVKGCTILLHDTVLTGQLLTIPVLCMVSSASIVSYLVLEYMWKMIQRNTLWYVGWYMVVPIIISLII